MVHNKTDVGSWRIKVLRGIGTAFEILGCLIIGIVFVAIAIPILLVMGIVSIFKG